MQSQQPHTQKTQTQIPKSIMIIPATITSTTTTETNTTTTTTISSTPERWSFEVPSWAAPATGEARLEPICESLGLQTSVDLKSKTVFRIGRSPKSDVQLHYAFCSRRHALLFHHTKGSCYVVDCGSSHGTYVNGVRVSPPRPGGVMVPHKVRRGSMIRFGGPGAPVFMLKSFRFDLEEMKDYPVSNSLGAMVRLNTRINALGISAKDTVLQNLSNKRSFGTTCCPPSPFDCLSTSTDEPQSKRQRCSSPPISQHEQQPPRLVSPEIQKSCFCPATSTHKQRRVIFSDNYDRIFFPALISPSVSNDENER